MSECGEDESIVSDAAVRLLDCSDLIILRKGKYDVVYVVLLRKMKTIRVVEPNMLTNIPSYSVGEGKVFVIPFLPWHIFNLLVHVLNGHQVYDDEHYETISRYIVNELRVPPGRLHNRCTKFMAKLNEIYAENLSPRSQAADEGMNSLFPATPLFLSFSSVPDETFRYTRSQCDVAVLQPSNQRIGNHVFSSTKGIRVLIVWGGISSCGQPISVGKNFLSYSSVEVVILPRNTVFEEAPFTSLQNLKFVGAYEELYPQCSTVTQLVRTVLEDRRFHGTTTSLCSSYSHEYGEAVSFYDTPSASSVTTIAPPIVNSSDLRLNECCDDRGWEKATSVFPELSVVLLSGSYEDKDFNSCFHDKDQGCQWIKDSEEVGVARRKAGFRVKPATFAADVWNDDSVNSVDEATKSTEAKNDPSDLCERLFHGNGRALSELFSESTCATSDKEVPSSFGVLNAVSKVDDSPLRSFDECSICMDAMNSVVILPCRHLATCENCCKTNNLVTCPICRSPIESFLHVFTV